MGVELRDYQTAIIRGLYKTIHDNKDASSHDRTAIIALATGGGKTAVSGKVVKDFLARGTSALFLVSMRSLLFQAQGSMKEFHDLDSGIIASGITNPSPESPIQIASIDTLVNRDKPSNVGLVIIDECHTAGYPPGQRWIFDKDEDGNWLHWRKDCWIVGLSATPERTKPSEYMGELYRHLIEGPQPSRLMEIAKETGYTQGLCSPVYKGFLPSKQLDLSGVKTRMGDYDPGQLDRVVDTPLVRRNIIESWKQYAIADGSLRDAKLTLYFGTSLHNAESVVEDFNREFRDEALACGFEDGIIAKFLSGDNTTDERRYWFSKFEQKKILFLGSCDIISVGFDVKGVEIVYPRPTKSRVVQIQQEGRGARTCPEIGKTKFLIIDLGLNCLKPGMGRLDDEIRYSLEPRSKKKAKGEAPLKVCPECGHISLAFATICDESAGGCGYEFPSRSKEEVDGQLVTLESREDIRNRTIYQRLAKQAFLKDYSPSFAKVRFRTETRTPTLAREVSTGSKLWVKKSLFRRVTIPVAGDMVEVTVKAVSSSDGMTILATSQGPLTVKENSELDVVASVKKHWTRGAVFGDKPSQFHQDSYMTYLARQANKRGLKNPQSWIKQWFVAEFGREPNI